MLFSAFASETWLETDLVPLGETLLAWLGLVALVDAVVLVMVRRQSSDDPLADAGGVEHD